MVTSLSSMTMEYGQYDKKRPPDITQSGGAKIFQWVSMSDFTPIL